MTTLHRREEPGARRIRLQPTRLTRTFGALLGGQIGGRLVRLIYVLVLARLLDPFELGIYFYGIGIYVALLGLAVFGQGTLLAARVPQRPGAAARWFRYSLAIRFTATVVAALAGLAFVLIQETAGQPSLVVALFLGALLFRSFVSWVREAHVALEQAGWIPRYETSFRALEAAAGVALVLCGLGVAWLAALHCLTWALEASACARLAARSGRIALRPAFRWRLMRPMLLLSIWYCLSLGLLMVFAQASLVALRWLGLDLAGIGQYGIALQGYFALLLVPAVLATALVPALSRARKLNNAGDHEAIGALIRWIFAGGLLIGVVVEGYGPWAIKLALGPEFAMVAKNFSVLAWGLGANAATMVMIQSLNALGAKIRAAAIALVMVAAQLAFLSVLYGTLGVEAAPVGVLAGAFAGFGAAALALRGPARISGFGWWLKPPLLVGCAFVLMRGFDISPQIMAPISLAVLLAGMFVLRLTTREELAYVTQRFGHMRRGVTDADRHFESN